MRVTGSPSSSGVDLEPVGAGVLEAVEGPVEHLDAGQPLHLGHAVPAGDEQPQGSAVLRGEGSAVHRPHEQDVGPQRLGQR